MGPAPVRSQVDPVGAARAEAAQAMEQTRAAIQAMQQNAAALGLSPEALSETAGWLLQQLPRLDGPEANGDAAAGGGAVAPGLPPAVSQLAASLAAGLGTIGSGLTEQLRKAAATATAATAARAPEGLSGAAADADSASVAGDASAAANGVNGANGANGAAPAPLISSVVAPAPTAASGGVSLLSGLLSGLVGNVSGVTVASPPLPLGSMRLVAGAHMIPHVDKVEKGGEVRLLWRRLAVTIGNWPGVLWA